MLVVAVGGHMWTSTKGRLRHTGPKERRRERRGKEGEREREREGINSLVHVCTCSE